MDVYLNKINVSISARYTQCLCFHDNIPLGIHACEDVDQWLCEKPNLISLLMNYNICKTFSWFIHYNIWSSETMIDIVHVLGKNM